MKNIHALRRLLSAVLAASLFLFVLPCQASAEDAGEATVTEDPMETEEPEEPTAPENPTEETEEPVETDAATEPETPRENEEPAGDDTPGTEPEKPSGSEPIQVLAEPDDPVIMVEPVTMTPDGGGILPGEDAISLRCATEGASIYYATSQDGEAYTDFVLYAGELSPEVGFQTLYVKAYAAKEDCTDSTETVCVFTEDTEPDRSTDLDWNLYFGQLHAHTDLSDGLGSVTEAFEYAANVEGLDFLAVTDHSNSFANADSGSIARDGTAVCADWAAGKAAAAGVTDGDFVGIFGYEMTWQEGKHLGHINTFNTPGWQSRDQDNFSSQPTALENYYQALTTVPGSISQFNHPGTAYGNFENFSHYSAAYDEAIQLLEVGGEGGFTAYDYYTQALDAGWHVAPTNSQNNHNGAWGDANSARTVVLADALTEESLYDAMAHYRVYATEDSDLTVYYQLNGYIMGSILRSAEDPQISVYINDPTDTAIGNVEVVADGGTVVGSQSVDAASETVTFCAPGGYDYYYIRITQPDGDIAVTAPVWVDSAEDMGIGSFCASADLPVQGQEISLTAELYNNEHVDFAVNSIEFSADGEVIHTAQNPGAVGALGTFSYTVPYTHSGMGVTEFCASVTGTVNGEPRTYEKSLTLRYRVPDMVTRVLVDGSHGNLGTAELKNLTSLAADANIDVTVSTGELTEAVLERGNLLVISAPETPFETNFVSLVDDFVANGGNLILCGQSDAMDTSLQTSAELNKLLCAVDSTLRLNCDTATDEENNGGTPDALSPTVFNTGSPWCADISEEQFYSQHSGCSVDTGCGTWLVRNSALGRSRSTDGGDVLLACEETACGGTVFAAGSFFLSDSEMPLPKNAWDPPRANQSILAALLDMEQEQVQLPLHPISDVRRGEPGQVFRIRGYVTAGTSNPYTTFADTIYIQDDTGGIAVVPFTESGVQVGTPMEITGYLSNRQGNPVLELIDYKILAEDFYRHVPKTKSCGSVMDYETHGGELMQVEGEVVDITYCFGGKGVSRFTVKDIRGDLATVFIEDYIFSGAYGVNRLASQVKTGRVVRAMGILHLDADGSPVLRVRNCDEVVYVPPIPDPANPKTGDVFGWLQK